MSLPPLLGWGKYGPEAANISCSVSWEIHDPSSNNQSYITFLFIFGLVIPVIIITASYSAIIYSLKQVRKRIGILNFVLKCKIKKNYMKINET